MPDIQELFKNNSVCKLLGIRYPIIQAGMVWCSGWRLASAASKAGILGVIGSGSMTPEVLNTHILKCKDSLKGLPFGVNLPLFYSRIDEQVELILKNNVPVVITSAGSPSLFTTKFKAAGIIVIHVVSSTKFAIKAQKAGVDAVIAEGFEAGGHNGREETTTLCLIPSVAQYLNIPLLAAGGITTGRAMLACFALGASGVQIGTRFAASVESSGNINYKNAIIACQEGETVLTLKKRVPVRMFRNALAQRFIDAENKGASLQELEEILGRGRNKLGLFDGDINEGELEMGQGANMVSKLETVQEIVDDLLNDYIITQSKF